jgi:hypothetical protein
MEPADEQDAFKCPITTERMSDPVIATDGHSYEREAIERWIATRKLLGVLATSPKTGLVLKSELLVPNHALRNAIEGSVPHQPPQRSPSPKPKRTKQTATSAVSLNQTGSSDLIHVTDLIRHAESLVDAGDVRGVLDALLPVGRLVSDPAVRASVLPDHLVTSLSRTGIEPIHDSLLCHQENRVYLVLLQALAVHELSKSELATVEPTLAGVISVLKIAVCTNIQ